MAPTSCCAIYVHQGAGYMCVSVCCVHACMCMHEMRGPTTACVVNAVHLTAENKCICNSVDQHVCSFTACITCATLHSTHVVPAACLHTDACTLLVLMHADRRRMHALMACCKVCGTVLWRRLDGGIFMTGVGFVGQVWDSFTSSVMGVLFECCLRLTP